MKLGMFLHKDKVINLVDTTNNIEGKYVIFKDEKLKL